MRRGDRRRSPWASRSSSALRRRQGGRSAASSSRSMPRSWRSPSLASLRRWSKPRRSPSCVARWRCPCRSACSASPGPMARCSRSSPWPCSPSPDGASARSPQPPPPLPPLDLPPPLPPSPPCSRCRSFAIIAAWSLYIASRRRRLPGLPLLCPARRRAGLPSLDLLGLASPSTCAVWPRFPRS
jgi:hypothetical protein